jgi:hypothetical protein
MVVATSVLVLNELGMEWGFLYGLALTGVSAVCTVIFVFVLDRDRVIAGASVPHRKDRPVRMPVTELTDQTTIPVETAGD